MGAVEADGTRCEFSGGDERLMWKLGESQDDHSSQAKQMTYAL